MATLKKIEANRANSEKSTGPRTAKGKAASRNNAFKHGMRSRSVVIPGEDPAEFAAMLEALVKEFEPSTPDEHYILKQLASARWRLERLHGVEAALMGADDVDMDALERVSRWITRVERACYLALREVRNLCKAASARAAKSNAANQKTEDDSNLPTGWLDPVTGVFTPFDYYPSEHQNPPADPNKKKP